MVFQVSQHLTLRRAIAADAGWATPLLFAAGPALFSYILASPPDQAQAILQQAFTYPHHAFSFEHTQVAEIDGTPVGLMIGYPGDLKRQADEKVHFVMARLMPLRKLPKILVNVADLSRIKQDVEPDDYYILGISVLPEFRHQGVASYCLAQAEAEAESLGCEAMCVDVSYTNTPAQQLFAKQGYEIVCSKTTERFEQMTRSGGIHRMMKLLPA
ncbi:MAG: GNAT family N-acetyltransferase [Leptolyngbyaceae cyanobacterium bins.349]|nr:GNAT family N-acetyltransferase [Leptolyngbyaceae cyanobacterium bins.349]